MKKITILILIAILLLIAPTFVLACISVFETVGDYYIFTEINSAFQNKWIDNTYLEKDYLEIYDRQRNKELFGKPLIKKRLYELKNAKIINLTDKDIEKISSLREGPYSQIIIRAPYFNFFGLKSRGETWIDYYDPECYGMSDVKTPSIIIFGYSIYPQIIFSYFLPIAFIVLIFIFFYLLFKNFILRKKRK